MSDYFSFAKCYIYKVTEMFNVWDNAIILQRGFMFDSVSYLGTQTLKGHLNTILWTEIIQTQATVSRSAYS